MTAKMSTADNDVLGFLSLSLFSQLDPPPPIKYYKASVTVDFYRLLQENTAVIKNIAYGFLKQDLQILQVHFL